MPLIQRLVAAAACAVASAHSHRNDLKTEEDMVAYMAAHPSRAYFAGLVRHGWYSSMLEVGVADGRFAEHNMQYGSDAMATYLMVEPFPNPQLRSRYPEMDKDRVARRRRRASSAHDVTVGAGYGVKGDDTSPWSSRGVGKATKKKFLQGFSTDEKVLRAIPKASVDLVYLDGGHHYGEVKAEMEVYWERVTPGGVLAGHDYCKHSEKGGYPCLGCENVPHCVKYTPYGVAHGKDPLKVSQTQHPVVKAVQEWLYHKHPELRLHHTAENFTRASLAADGMDYDLVITHSYNPSWYIFKPKA